MPCSSYQEDASTRPASTRLRRRRLIPLAASVLVLLAAGANTASAAGPLYAVPSHPPTETESVGFTNALNHRVRRLPPPLDPPVAQGPIEVEARVQALERGVVVRRSTPSEGASKRSGASPQPKREQERSAVPAVDQPADRGPLTLAFLAAGALALTGLLFGVRGRPSRPPQQA